MSPTTVNGSNWMEAVDTSTPISKLSIPGTHESCALYGGGKSQCQWFGISDQLRRGVRFLDVRCVHSKGSQGTKQFPIYHGVLYEYTNFQAVQEECIAFLDAHTSETILMNVQREEPQGLVSRSADDFAAMFTELVDRRYWTMSDTIPTLADVAGKIVLIRTPWDSAEEEGWPETTPTAAFGLPWEGFNQNRVSSYPLFETQNGWQGAPIGDSDAHKQAAVEALLVEAYDGVKSPDSIYLNFLSRAAGNYVGTAAQATNTAIQQYLQSNLTGTGRRLGILAMDFVGNTGWTGSLEEQVIRRNPFMAGYEFVFPVSPFKIRLSDPADPGRSWWMVRGEHDWAVARDASATGPTADDPIVFELYTDDREDFYKAADESTYLSVSSGGQVGLYNWAGRSVFTPDGPELMSHYAKKPMRLKPNGELWCGTEGDLVNVTFVAA